MANVTKIYELKTLGYDKIITELKAVEKMLDEVKLQKLELNKAKLLTGDEKEIQKLNKALKGLTVANAELMIQKQKLNNEIKAGMAIRQAELSMAQKLTTSKKVEVQAEAGSLTDLINKRKELTAAIHATAAAKGEDKFVNFEGQRITLREAVDAYKALAIAEKEYIQQSEIATNAQINQANAIAAANKIEVNSQADVIRKRKELQALVKPIDSTSGTQVEFRGALLDYKQAIGLIKALLVIEKAYTDQQKLDKPAVVAKSKAVVAGLQAEYHSLKDIVTKRKELQAAMSLVNPNTGTTVDFRGQALTYQQAVEGLKAFIQIEKDYAAQGKVTAQVVQAEIGSYTHLVARIKELGTLLKGLSSQSGRLSV